MKLRSVALEKGDQLPVGRLRSTWRVQGHRLGMLVEVPEEDEGAPLWMVTAECGDYYCGCGHGHVLGIYPSMEEAEREAELFDTDVDRNGNRAWPYVEVSLFETHAHSTARYVEKPRGQREGYNGLIWHGGGPAFASAIVPREGPYCAVGAISQSLKEGGTPHADRTGVRDLLHRVRVHLARRLGR